MASMRETTKIWGEQEHEVNSPSPTSHMHQDIAGCSGNSSAKRAAIPAARALSRRLSFPASATFYGVYGRFSGIYCYISMKNMDCVL